VWVKGSEGMRWMQYVDVVVGVGMRASTCVCICICVRDVWVLGRVYVWWETQGKGDISSITYAQANGDHGNANAEDDQAAVVIVVACRRYNGCGHGAV